ncbi:hypothetical protein PUN28_006222 [Cardiocondyla obscurior]|uniref:Uncharacterized protein n=1 Tax=Cardiocondyla obscurior TaxID=286306 RepID=A0AAW2GCZ9_9HYME
MIVRSKLKRLYDNDVRTVKATFAVHFRGNLISSCGVVVHERESERERERERRCDFYSINVRVTYLLRDVISLSPTSRHMLIHSAYTSGSQRTSVPRIYLFRFDERQIRKLFLSRN